MRRLIFPFLLLLLLSPLFNYAITRDSGFKDASVSDWVYALAENGTLLKLTDGMNPLWAVKIRDAHFERLRPTNDGVLLLGDVLAKLDGNGTLLWAKNLSVEDAEPLPNGDTAFLIDNVVGLISRDGRILWAAKSLPKGINEQIPKVDMRLVAPLGGAILLVGTITPPDDSKSHLFLSALSLNGSLLWAKALNTGYYDSPDTALSIENDALVAGVYGGGSDAPWIADYFVLRVTPEGEIEWFNSYPCPKGENWDAFWTLKIRGAFCKGGVCAFDTTTGTFIVNSAGKPLAYLNVSGKVAGIMNDSLVLLSNGTVLLAPLTQNGETEKCYTLKIHFRDGPVVVSAVPAEFKAPDLHLSVVKLGERSEPKKEDENLNNSQETEPKGKNYWGVTLISLALVGIALAVSRKMGR